MQNDLYDSGAISGAILDAESPEATAHAEKYYEYIRNIHNDVEKIANNTDFTKDQILLVKQYIFYSEHELSNGIHRFEPDFFMAQSWRRLAFEPENIQLHDIMLIKHELYEMALVTQGIPYHEVHDLSNEKGFNYQRMCKEYYKELGVKQNKHNKDSGAISYTQNKDDNWER
jgi:hypothetical protein